MTRWEFYRSVQGWGERQRRKRHEDAMLALAIANGVGGGKDVTATSIYKMVTGEDPLRDSEADEGEAERFFKGVDQELGVR